MDTVFFGSGDNVDPVADNNKNLQPGKQITDKKYEEGTVNNYNNNIDSDIPSKNKQYYANETSLTTSTDNDGSLPVNFACSQESSDTSMPDITDRITECKNIIASIKLELNAEKKKPNLEYEHMKAEPEITIPCSETNSANYLADLSYPTDFFTASVDNKLYSEDNLIQYEKQLQKYQRTLNMAQNAKKNAIRKQMLAKAFKLKLLEVENQCNIELLRIKQNLQCLEPLKMIAESWKTEKDNDDLSKYNLIPLFPEIYSSTTSDTFSAEGIDIEQLKN